MIVLLSFNFLEEIIKLGSPRQLIVSIQIIFLKVLLCTRQYLYTWLIFIIKTLKSNYIRLWNDFGRFLCTYIIFIFITRSFFLVDVKEGKCLMHVVRDSHPLKPPLFSSNRVTSRKSKELWTKSPECNNIVYEEKEKYHYFTHPAEDHTNFYPPFNQRERMGTWEKEEAHTRSKKK